MKEEEERKKERLEISKMSSIQLISTFEQLVRNGAGVANIPLIWYRDEILDRCVISGFNSAKKGRMKKMKEGEEDKIKIIKDLEDIKDKKSIVIDETEALLIEWKKDQERLANLLMSLKSKVKNDEETENDRRRE